MLLVWQEVSQIVFLAGMLLIMPGPTNTLLLFSGAMAGFSKARELILAEMVGYFIAISAWGCLMAFLINFLPGVVVIAKIVCAGYVFWLSIKIWNFQQKDPHRAIIKAKDVFLATLFNPKAFVLATYVMPKATFTEVGLYFNVMLVFFSTLLPVSVIWCLGGHFLYLTRKGGVEKGRTVFFRLIALVLGVFPFFILYNVVMQSGLSKQVQ